MTKTVFNVGACGPQKTFLIEPRTLPPRALWEAGAGGLRIPTPLVSILFFFLIGEAGGRRQEQGWREQLCTFPLCGVQATDGDPIPASSTGVFGKPPPESYSPSNRADLDTGSLLLTTAGCWMGGWGGARGRVRARREPA